MPKQSLEIKDFSGGLNAYADARDIKDDQFSQLWNFSSSQAGILKIGGSLVQHIFGLPHNNSNFQSGYGLFATSVDTTPTVIEGQLEGGFEEGTVAAYSSSATVITLATTPSIQSVANHSTNDFYNNKTILIYDGNGAGQSRRIVDYNGSTYVATITEAFTSTIPNTSSKYKIFSWAGDNASFGDSDTTTDLNYIDKGGISSGHWMDSIQSHDTNYSNSYFFRTKVGSITTEQSSDLGFVTYNPSKDHSWAAGDALDANSGTVGNTTLKPGIEYVLSFWAKSSAQYYGYVSDVGHGDIYPFIQIYSDSVTDGTSTGLYLFQGRDKSEFMRGSDSSYQYAQNITKQYVNNGSFEQGSSSATGGDGGRSLTYDPPTEWMAYDGFDDDNNHAISYSYAAPSFTDDTCDYNNDPTIACDATKLIHTNQAVSGTGIPAGSLVGAVTGGDGIAVTSFELKDAAGDPVSTTTGDVVNGTLTFTEDIYGGDGNSLNMAFGSSFSHKPQNAKTNYGYKQTALPECYLYQDLTLEDNQWYDLSFIYSRNDATPMITYSILDTGNLTSTAVYAVIGGGGTTAANDSSVTLTVDDGSGSASVATTNLLAAQEVYKSDGTFLGVCTAVTNTTTIVFGGGTADTITNNDVLYIANYIVPWTDSLLTNSTGATNWKHFPIDNLGQAGIGNDANNINRNKFFVPDNSGTPKIIRIAFSALFGASDTMRLDGISVKKSFPDLASLIEPDGSLTPRSDLVTNWNEYKFKFKIPSEFNEVSDWVINLNAGSRGFQSGADSNVNSHAVYFDSIKIETSSLGGDLIFLNDNTSSNSKINIYDVKDDNWIENTELTWDGINMKPVYNYINGMLKISDANFQSGNKSKLFYYHNLKHHVRDDILSQPPPLITSASGNGEEIAQKFDALKYINDITMDGAHQYFDADTESNWPLDMSRKVISYYNTDSDNSNTYWSGVLFDNTSTPVALTSTNTFTANPFYLTWAGAATGSGDAATTDMQTTIAAYSSGSISRVNFKFLYKFQALDEFYPSAGGTSSNFKVEYARMPYFIITVGKRTSGGTDVFNESDGIPTATDRKNISLGDADTVYNVSNSKEAIVKTLDGEEYNGETSGTLQNDIWSDASMDFIGPQSANKAYASKEFEAEVSFEDGEIEVTDDMIARIQIVYPSNNAYGPSNQQVTLRDFMIEEGYTVGNGSSITGQIARYDYIDFSNIDVSFRATNWTVVLDGFNSSDNTGTKVNYTFDTPTETAFGWGERVFTSAISSVNIFDEESHLKANESYIGGTISDNLSTTTSSILSGQSPDVTVYIGFDVAHDDYRKELKYYMKDTNSDIWYLQFYVNLEKMQIYSTTSNYKTNGIKNYTNQCYTFTIPRERILNFNEVDSYESQTLLPDTLKASELVCDYKTSIVANSRLYVGNIRQDGQIFPDRMIKSPVGKYNILPKSNFIDVAINDGDEITALEYYKDKIIQFKKNKVFVINTSGDYEFLEDTFDNIGIEYPYQTTKTPYGVVWANQSGLHLYNGENLVNLIQNKIPNNSKDSLIGGNYWRFDNDPDSGFKPLVGYDSLTKDIVVKLGVTTLANQAIPDGYIYNLESESMYMTYKAFAGVAKNANNPYFSNFSSDSKGNLISYAYANSSEASINYGINDILKWQHTEGNDIDLSTQKGAPSNERNATNVYASTKDFTFGNITSRNKIYKVYITYKSEDKDGSATDSKILIKYNTNGASGSFTETFSDNSTNYSASTGFASAENWTTAILKPSSSINNIYSIQFQLSYTAAPNTFPAPNFKINDISIVYRAKRIK